MKDYSHTPVLLQEAISYLNPSDGGYYIDVTLGGGGYTREISQRIGESGKVLAIDADHDAIANFENNFADSYPNVSLAQGNFGQLTDIAQRSGFEQVDGIVADIGLSSYQIDQSGRGITFQSDEPLDMRFDKKSETENAQQILASHGLKDLQRIFAEYGEEKFAGKIARTIVHSRQDQPVTTTSQLAEIVEASLPKPVKHKWSSSARRIFQALRIAVNSELDNLDKFLPQAFDLLKPGGRLVIVSFHSLEDRRVKQYFTSLLKNCVCPPDFPICQCDAKAEGELLTKKPITADEVEQEQNPRSKSAKLRAIKKL